METSYSQVSTNIIKSNDTNTYRAGPSLRRVRQLPKAPKSQNFRKELGSFKWITKIIWHILLTKKTKILVLNKIIDQKTKQINPLKTLKNLPFSLLSALVPSLHCSVCPRPLSDSLLSASLKSQLLTSPYQVAGFVTLFITYQFIIMAAWTLPGLGVKFGPSRGFFFLGWVLLISFVSMLWFCLNFCYVCA